MIVFHPHNIILQYTTPPAHDHPLTRVNIITTRVARHLFVLELSLKTSINVQPFRDDDDNDDDSETVLFVSQRTQKVAYYCIFFLYITPSPVRIVVLLFRLQFTYWQVYVVGEAMWEYTRDN